MNKNGSSYTMWSKETEILDLDLVTILFLANVVDIKSITHANNSISSLLNRSAELTVRDLTFEVI
jgi:hypothetical protein